MTCRADKLKSHLLRRCQKSSHLLHPLKSNRSVVRSANQPITRDITSKLTISSAVHCVAFCKAKDKTLDSSGPVAGLKVPPGTEVAECGLRAKRTERPHQRVISHHVEAAMKSNILRISVSIVSRPTY